MLPIRDILPCATVPVVTRALVVANVAVFAAFAGRELDAAVEFGAVAAHFTGLPPELPPQVADVLRPIPADGLWPLRAVTHMFVHGDLLHLLGNMWFLWIFGDNVEDRLGHARFAGFYLLAGLAALAAQIAADPGSGVPMVGASGALAGVLGAYLVLYPNAKVVTLVPLGFLPLLIDLPAAFFLLAWLAIQVLSALGTVGPGVAWWAHIGGFAFGALLVWFSAAASTKRANPRDRRPRPAGPRLGAEPELRLPVRDRGRAAADAG